MTERHRFHIKERLGSGASLIDILQVIISYYKLFPRTDCKYVTVLTNLCVFLDIVLHFHCLECMSLKAVNKTQ